MNTARPAQDAQQAPSDSRKASLMPMLNDWAQRGVLRTLDSGLVRFIAELAPATDAHALLAAALVSHQLGRGHVCLDLQAALQDPESHLALSPDAVRELTAGLRGVTLAGWQAALTACRCCACADETHADRRSTPLVLSGSRLYLRRYWQHESTVRTCVAARVQPAPLATPEHIRPWLDTLFPTASTDTANSLPNWQKLACALAARQRLTVITGGPGTGKTTTVARLLALLHVLSKEPPLIGLAAPTGKAAARLTESLRAALAALPVLPGSNAGLRARLQASVGAGAVTLHRLLGARLYRPVAQLLPLDVLVVDEASMIDLALMAALLAALPPHARLVLLGDKDQLASVEAGAVLGELCRRAEEGHYNDATAAWLTACTGAPPPARLCDAAGLPLDQAIAMLRTSHRFGANSGIGQLAGAVHAGNTAQACALLAADLPDVRRVRLKVDLSAPGSAHGLAQAPALRALVLGSADDEASPAQVLRQLHATRTTPDAPRAAWNGWAATLLRGLTRFQLLCALREGPWGVTALNAALAAILRDAGLLPADGSADTPDGWFEGRPVLVTRNDTGLRLMNGDMGLALRIPARFDVDGQPDPAAGWALRVAFPHDEGAAPVSSTCEPGVRWLPTARLSAVETVWAMTVHKAQGSEFEHAALLLPDRMAPVLTRELIYTGLTRARRRFTLLGPAGADAVFDAALARRVQRSGGPLW